MLTSTLALIVAVSLGACFGVVIAGLMVAARDN